MTASLSARRRKMQEQVGPHGEANVWVNKRQKVRHQVRCLLCDPQDRPRKSPWVTRSDGEDKGQGSGFLFALDEWANHVVHNHEHAWPETPWADERWDEVRERRDERKEAEQRAWEAILSEAGLPPSAVSPPPS